MKGIADYEFVRFLGDGNHGAFWLAEAPPRLDLPPGTRMAVKTLANRANDDDFRRMANELRVYALVTSLDLVQILDAGQDNGRLFYAMRHLPDGSLGHPARPLERRTVVCAVAAAARAAHQLHEAGIAHRDIKPSNILLDGDRGQLSDLGLAQIVNPGQAATGIGPVGTIEFLAPEVVKGADASRASDVWSLGVTLHSVLAGRSLYVPVSSGSLIDTLRQVITDQPIIDGSISAPAAAIIERCLMPDPADRFPTAAAMAEALEEITR